VFTLGINAAFHDCSACLVKDGVVVAAAEEERFTRVKHGKRPLPFTVWQLPFHAIDYCLGEAGVVLADVDHVAYSYDPYIQLGGHAGAPSIALPLAPSAAPSAWLSPWDPLALSYVVNAPRQLASGAPHHLQQRFGRGGDAPYRWHFVEHHLAHEASAFLAAPFDDCAVLTIDGRGERCTTSYASFRDGQYCRLAQVDYPHSLGLLYEDVTAHLGFLPSSDEYKVMALAASGKPVFAAALRALLRYEGQGRFSVAPTALESLFGPARRRGEALCQRHFDIAHSMQLVLEETVLQMTRWLHAATGLDALALAGGVALNCVLNAKVRAHGPFARVWAQPAAGDAGTALGAALWIDRVHGGRPDRGWQMEHVFLGPQFDDADIELVLRESGLAYRRVADVAGEAARLLAQDKIVGWFQGRMEFGPRALGARSILASPLKADMKNRLNQIKDREDFRPVAPVVLEEAAGDWFIQEASPFMLFVSDVRPDKAARIPAACHVDASARVQTITRAQHALYYDLLATFATLTGVPVLVNTSFNTRGEPIVCTPREALASFCTTALDALAIGSFLLEKTKLASAE
jgi:carbamoyltransferase